MLLQRNILHALVPSKKNVQTAAWSPPVPEEWKPHVRGRRRLKLQLKRQEVHALAIIGSQGILPKEENSKGAGIRVSCRDSSNVRSDRAVGQSRLDNSDVRIPDRMADSDHTSRSSSNSAVEYARSDLLTDRARATVRVSVEQFVMAGRAEPGQRANDAGPEEEDGLFYSPKVGDYVIGTVASGNYGKLDVDIGAENLAHLFRKDVMPLEICNVRERSWAIPDDGYGVVEGPRDVPRFVYDEEVLNLGLAVPMVAERGTVLTLEVKGFSPAGVALLSARSVARGYAWQRVRQLHEYKAILKVQITEWTAAGLVAKIEGLRAFLPFYCLLNRPPESSTGGNVSYKKYVGQIVSVAITTVDELRCNLVISEKQAWVFNYHQDTGRINYIYHFGFVRGHMQFFHMTQNAYIGALVDGIITDIHTYGLHIRVKNTDLSGILHISNISRARIDNIECLFCVGEQVTAMVVPSNVKRKLSFSQKWLLPNLEELNTSIQIGQQGSFYKSTADLEMEDGLMLRDKEAVYRGAEKIAAEIARAYEKRNSEPTIDNNGDVDEGEQEVLIANWDWLEFGEKS